LFYDQVFKKTMQVFKNWMLTSHPIEIIQNCSSRSLFFNIEKFNKNYCSLRNQVGSGHMVYPRASIICI